MVLPQEKGPEIFGYKLTPMCGVRTSGPVGIELNSIESNSIYTSFDCTSPDKGASPGGP